MIDFQKIRYSLFDKQSFCASENGLVHARYRGSAMDSGGRFCHLSGASSVVGPFWVNGHFTPANFAPLLTNWYGLPALYNSLLLGGAVGVTGTFVGFTFAHAVTRLSLPQTFKFLLSGISMLPLISPPFTSSIALTLSLGPHGIFLKLLGPQNFDFYDFWGTFISETLTYYPIAFLTLTTILSRVDSNLEDAAHPKA